MASEENKVKHVIISEESHRRLKIFAAKYNLNMRAVLDWFVLTLIDEDGDPNITSLMDALEEIKRGDFSTIMDTE